jgi:hypothetical protein
MPEKCTAKDYIVGERWPVREAERAWKTSSLKYEKYQGKKYTWYVPNFPNCADGIHVDMHNPRSDGYGGATLKFTLVSGEVDSVKGPWHSNADALLADTGIDITKKYITFVVVSKERDQDERYRTIMKDVVYIDLYAEIGDFDRWKECAKPFVEEAVNSGKSLFYYSESSGGSSCGPVVFEGKLREKF